jgi:O-antigen/teichoic acid export membrane protein
MTNASDVDLAGARAVGTGVGNSDGTQVGAAGEESAAVAVRGLFGRDSIYLFFWVVQLGVAALFTPATTRLLAPSNFGLVAASIAVMQVLVAIGSMSLQTVVQRRYAAPGGERDARRLLTLAVAISLLVFVLADLTGRVWARALGLGSYPLAVRYAVAWACLTAISNAALGLLRSRDQLVPFAAVSLLQSVVAEGLSVLLILAVRRSAAEWILGELLAQAAAVTVAMGYARPLLLRWRDRKMAGAALVYSIPLVPAALAVFALESSDRLVVQHELGPAAVARYAVAYNIGSIPMMLLGALNTVWMPRVFALTDPRVRDSVLAQGRDALYALLIPVLAGLGIGAPVLLHIWAPASYRPDTLLVLVALVSSSSIAIAGAMSHTRVLLAEGRTLPVASATMLAAAVNLVLNIVLVPMLGLEGSALATLIGYASLHAWLASATRRGASRLPSPHRALVVRMMIAVAIAFAAALLPVNLPFLGIRLAIASACLAVFAGMMLTLAGRCASPQMRRIAAWMMSRALPAPA